MNLRDKLRSGGADDAPASDDVWGAASEVPEAEAPAKGRGKAAPKAAKPASTGPKLDVNRRFMVLAGAAAFLTALMGVMYINNSAAGLTAAGTKINVVVLAEDVGRGAKLTEDRLTTAEIPKAYLPKGYIEVGEDEKGLKKALTMVAAGAMVAGEPLIEARISPADRKLGIAYLLKRGERAKTIHVDAASGLGGLVKAGNEVDLITTIPDPNNDARRISTAVIQKARVIAVGDHLLGEIRSEEEEAKDESGGIESDSTITLAVPAGKVNLAALCEDLGLLKVVLRADGDDTIQKSPFTDEVIMALLSGRVPPKAVVRPAGGHRTVTYVAPPPRRWTPAAAPVRRDPPPRPAARPVAPKPAAAKPPAHNDGGTPHVIHFGGVTGQGGTSNE